MTDPLSPQPLPPSERLSLALGTLSAAQGRRSYRCRLVRAGLARATGNRPSDIEITEDALKSAFQRGLFDGRAVFVDHANIREYPSLHNLAGTTLDIEYDPLDRAILGTVWLFSHMSQLATLLDELLAAPNPPDVGLSIVFWPEWGEPRFENRESRSVSSHASRFSNHDSRPIRRIVDIRHVESVDLVFEPAADGRVLAALNASTAAHHPPLPGAAPHIAVSRARSAASNHNHTRPNPLHNSGGALMLEQLNTEPTGSGSPQELAAGWLREVASSAAGTMIAASGLPEASRQRLGLRTYADPDEVRRAIEAERSYLARLGEDRVIRMGGIAPRSPHISLGLTGFEQLEIALDALLAGVRPQKDVRPLSGVRELYMLLSGDYELEGTFKSERVQFANVNSSTMAGMVADALNKRLMNEFMLYPRWWEPAVIAEDFNSLQTVRWVTLGGVGELPTVAEGAAYTELTWDDLTETAAFVKKGGYLGLTMEAIDKDDTHRLRAAPKALAQAAWLTLSKGVSDVFTANGGTGPTISDGTALFTAGHGNLSATALSLTQWNAIRTAMRKQTELNSGERLGALVVPKYLLVPPDLEVTALQILASDKDYTYTLASAQAAPENVSSGGSFRNERLAFARERVIVVDLWTDTNNYAAVCDPNLYPTIGIGYRYGRAPEVFSVASPTAGLMFSNDTLPVKVRFFFAIAPIDYRGLYKGNVA